MTRMLTCPNNCDVRRFEALNAPLYVDAAGLYIEHDSRQAAFVCAECGSLAIDIAAAMREAERPRDADPQTLVCPGCETEMLPPEDEPLAAMMECPVCETRFTIEEGTPTLHGHAASSDGDAGNGSAPAGGAR